MHPLFQASCLNQAKRGPELWALISQAPPTLSCLCYCKLSEEENHLWHSGDTILNPTGHTTKNSSLVASAQGVVCHLSRMGWSVLIYGVSGKDLLKFIKLWNSIRFLIGNAKESTESRIHMACFQWVFSLSDCQGTLYHMAR